MVTEDILLAVSGEGGGLTIVRAWGDTGEPRFECRLHESSYDLDDEVDESGSATIRSPRVLGCALKFPDALEYLSPYPWHRLWPTKVTPDIATTTEAAVLARGGDAALKTWKERLAE